jgi:hypothetical protein
MPRAPKREIDKYIDKTVEPLPPPKKTRKFRWRWLVSYRPVTSDERSFVCRTEEDAIYHGALCAYLNRRTSDLEVEHITLIEKHFKKKRYGEVLDVWDLAQESAADLGEDPNEIYVQKVKYYSKVEGR